MLGWAGMVAQELVNGKEIFVNLGLAQGMASRLLLFPLLVRAFR
jgi:hypothetical protein